MGRVGKGFIVDVRQSRNDVARLLWSNIEFRMVRFQMVCHGPGMWGFIPLGLMKSYGKSFDSGSNIPAHQRHQQRGIYASGQEGPHRNIGNHAPANTISKELLQFFQAFGIIPGGLRTCRERFLYHIPILFQKSVALDVCSEEKAGAKFVYTGIDCLGGGYVSQMHQGGDRVTFDGRLEGGVTA